MPGPIRKFARRLRYLTSQPHWWAEVWSSVVLIAWGIISVSMPYALNAHHSFDALVRLAPEQFWERLVLAAGLFQGFSLLANRWQLRGIGAGISGALLCVILYSFAFSGRWFPAISFYAGYVLINFMALYKNIVRRDA